MISNDELINSWKIFSDTMFSIRDKMFSALTGNVKVGMIDEVKVLQAIQNCVNIPKCQDCPWEECEQEHETVKVPKSLLMAAIDLIRTKNSKVRTLLMRTEDLQNQLLGTIDDGR